MQNVRAGLVTIIPLLLLHLINPEPVDYEDVTCGTLFGDGRYCLNYTSVGLGAVPPQGKNVTTILHLKGNQIRAVGANAFKHEKLLVKLDLSNNRISHIDPSAFNHLSLLKEVWLGANPYLCETSICPFRKWLLANTNLVKDITQVTCNNSPYKDEQIIKLQSEPLCRNSTIHHGFEINTGTVFMIWIVVPIMITTLTAFYIVLNGNNRVGRAARSCWNGCCNWSLARNRPRLRDQQEEEVEAERGRSREEALTPVESPDYEMGEMGPGPASREDSISSQPGPSSRTNSQEHRSC